LGKKAVRASELLRGLARRESAGRAGDSSHNFVTVCPELFWLRAVKQWIENLIGPFLCAILRRERHEI
jgi:hypothetical protein